MKSKTIWWDRESTSKKVIRCFWKQVTVGIFSSDQCWSDAIQHQVPLSYWLTQYAEAGVYELLDQRFVGLFVMCKVEVMCVSYQTRRHPWSVTKWVRYSAMLWYEICFVRYFRSNLVDIKWCDSDNRFLEFWCHLAGLFLQTTCILVSIIKNFLRCLRADMFRFLHAIYWYRCKTICSSVNHKQLLVSVALWLQYLSCVVARSRMRQHIAYYGSSIAVSVFPCVYHVKDNQGFIHQFSCRARRLVSLNDRKMKQRGCQGHDWRLNSTVIVDILFLMGMRHWILPLAVTNVASS